MSSCYNCARSFSLLNREKACDRCGFAFCGKCLTNINADKDRDNYKGKKEIKVRNVEIAFTPLSMHRLTSPALDGFQVCGACKKIESGSPCSPAASVPRPRSPPTALERRIEQLNVLPPQPITVYSRESQKEKRMAKLKRGMTEEDTAIAERLERLQRDRKVLQRMPSDSEMEQRLATLKGVPQSEEAKVNGGGDPSIAAGFYHAPESRVPDATRAEDLISRMTEEVKLDDKAAEDGIGRAPADPAKDVAERLAKLRGLSVGTARFLYTCGSDHLFLACRWMKTRLGANEIATTSSGRRKSKKTSPATRRLTVWWRS